MNLWMAMAALAAGALLLALLWAYLGGDADGLVMGADKAAYCAGDAVKVTIRNGANSKATFGAPYAIYRWVDGEWRYADDLTPDVWIMVLYVLEPGRSFTQTVLEDAPPGRYMVVKNATVGDRKVELRAFFEVREC